MQKRIRVGKLERLQKNLTAMTARQRLQWAGDLFGAKAVATACLGADCAVMLHMLAEACPDARVFMIAPGDVSEDTAQAVRAVQQRLGLQVTLLDPYAPSAPARPIPGSPPGPATDSGEGLTLALDDAFCWISDARRSQYFGNPQAGVLECLEDGLYQLNPLCDWSQEQVDAYRELHALPRPAHDGWRAAAQSGSAYLAHYAAR